MLVSGLVHLAVQSSATFDLNYVYHINSVFVSFISSERQWNMWIPGFGNDELRPYKRAAVTEAHKQRMALIRKTIKKY